jgi:hypothetical protein
MNCIWQKWIRKSKPRKVRYEFEEVNEQHSLFKLYFVIHVTSKESNFDFSRAISLQNKLEKFSAGSQSSFYYKGDFSNRLISSLLNLLLSKKAEEKNNADKKVHHILIELIQNIKRHARTQNKMVEGQIFIEWKPEHIEVSTHNVAMSEYTGKLQKKVVDLNNSSKEELVRKSKEILADLESTNGLGLVDVANLIYPNKISMNITEMSESFSELFFNLKVNNE